VGKSAILTRFSENAFLNNYSSTIGIDFNSRMIRVDHSICKLEIWDTAGNVASDLPVRITFANLSMLHADRPGAILHDHCQLLVSVLMCKACFISSAC
jgi:GTPase SAR1 family protein